MATTPTLDQPAQVITEKKRNWIPLVVILIAILGGAAALWWAVSGGGDTRIEKAENHLAAVESGTFEEWSADFASTGSSVVVIPTNYADVVSDRD